MLLVILFVFIICWLPVQIYVLYHEYRSSLAAEARISSIVENDFFDYSW